MKPKDDPSKGELCPSCAGGPAICYVHVPVPGTCARPALSQTLAEVCVVLVLSLWTGRLGLVFLCNFDDWFTSWSSLFFHGSF